MLLLLLACAHRPATPEVTMNPEAVAGVTDPALRSVLSDHWEDLLRRSPTWATRLGDHRHDAELGEWGVEATARARASRDGFLARARGLDPAGLSPGDRLTHALFMELLETDAATDPCRLEEWDLSPRANPLVELNSLPEGHPVRGRDDAEALLSRYRQAPGWLQGSAEQLRAGIRSGRTPDAASTRLVLTMVEDQLAKADREWEMVVLPDAPPGEPEPAWRARLAATMPPLRAALVDYAAFLRDELLPVARPPQRAGTSALPGGAACYAALIRRETSLDLSATELHRVGLEELEKIHAELRGLGARLFGTDDLAAIFARLREDPALRFASRAEVEGRAAEALARAKAAMPRFFGRLPLADCVVKPVPDFEAPYTTIAYYRQPVPGEAPGEYRVNSWAPETRPRFEAEVLAWHEAIPGHHLQIAIAQELPAMPAFRRHLGTTAYVEGWALYTERLAEEMGLYSGDLDRMGMLSFDTWRASRLVVDTGIHAQGWTREQAVGFMLANTPLAENNVRNEVDRYITWPGQALAYKTGQIELWRLRRDAEARLGPRFDLAGFHDVVLGQGAVTLPVLRGLVEDWVTRR